MSITVAGGLAIAVIALKYDVAKLEDELARVNRGILNEQRAIHVLDAEWTHLNDPARLATLASQVLAMRPVDPAAMRSFDALPWRDAAPPDGGPARQAPAIARTPDARKPADGNTVAAPLPLDDSAVPADEFSVVIPAPADEPPADPVPARVGG